MLGRAGGQRMGVPGEGIPRVRGKPPGLPEVGTPHVSLGSSLSPAPPSPPRSHRTLQGPLVPEPRAGGSGARGRRQHQHSGVASAAQARLREGEAPGRSQSGPVASSPSGPPRPAVPRPNTRGLPPLTDQRVPGRGHRCDPALRARAPRTAPAQSRRGGHSTQPRGVRVLQGDRRGAA